MEEWEERKVQFSTVKFQHDTENVGKYRVPVLYIKNKILGGNICKQKEIESLDSVTVLKEDTQLEPPIVSHCPSIKYFASLHKLVSLVGLWILG